MEIQIYLRMLRRGWWIIILTALAAVTVSLVLSYLATPVYRSTARFIVSPSPTLATKGTDVISSLATLDKRSIVLTYAEILNSPRIYRETLAPLGLTESSLVDYAYSAVVLPDTNIIELAVEGTDPETVMLLANKVGDQAITYAQTLYQIYDLTMLDPAILPTTPIHPQPLRDAGLSLVLGLAAGVGLAFLRELVRTPIETFLHQFTMDSLSLALNRKTFERRLEETLVAKAGAGLSLCTVELEGLKSYIDVLPVSALQQTLRHVNSTMNKLLRGDDIIGRWTDTQFSVLLVGTTGDGALNTMERVHAALSAPFSVDVTGESLNLQPLIGIGESRVGADKNKLIIDSEQALERARVSEKRISLNRAVSVRPFIQQA